LNKTDIRDMSLLLILAIIKLSVADPSEGFLEGESESLSHWNGSVRYGCPDISELPRVDHHKSVFIGARIYYLYGNCVPGLSCNGDFWDTQNGAMISPEPGYCTAIGTLFVHAGCTFHAFKEYNFQGSVKTFEGPLFVTKMPDGIFWGDQTSETKVPCVSSFLVDCRQHYPDCQPSDRWETVASLDNTGSSLPSEFTYTYEVGTSWSHEMSEEMGIDSTIESEISVGFFRQFETRVGVSQTTQHNWGEISTEEKSESKTISTKTEVPARGRIKIQQVIGSCGGSKVYTLDVRHVSSKL